MYKLITVYLGFLLIGLSLKAQNNGQLYNEGKLYISPETKMTAESDFINAAEGIYNNDGEVLLRGHFLNNGEAGYIQGGGLTRFEGFGIQEISGDAPVTYYNVLFDNQNDPYPFHLSGMMSIDGGVSFFNGIVDNERYPGVFEMTTEAYHFNTEDVSHVSGPVNRLGNVDFTYPVGKEGYYRPASLASLSDPKAYFEGEFFIDDSNRDSPHYYRPGSISRIDDQEYWVLEPVFETTNEEAIVGLSYRDVTTPQFIMEAVQKDLVTIVRWDDEAHLWIDEGGTVDAENEMVTTQVSGFGRFTLALLDREVAPPCRVEIYNAVTPNGDGFNDYFRIENPNECARQLRVKIFNRWGVKVFESDDYGTGGDVFDGYSKGRATIKSSNQLPSGTYFYVLEYDYEEDISGDEKTAHKAGYLYLSTDGKD